MTAPPRDAVRALLEELVATPSPTGHEARAARVLAGHLAAWGLDPRIDEAGNVIAEVGPQRPDARHVVLLGHIDTVPGDLPVRWEGGTLWGRGAVDAKGPLVAHATALASLDEPDLHVTLVAAVGEEGRSPGARALAPRLLPDALIIAEPTGVETVGLGYKGCLKGTLTARAEPSHPGSGHPTAGERLLAGVEALTAWTRNPARDPGFERYTLRMLDLASSRSGSEEMARARIDLRLPAAVPDSGDLQALLPSGVTLSVDEAVAAVRVAPSDPVATALRSALRSHDRPARAVVKTGTSDWNVVAPFWGCPGAAYGPGDPTLDHTPHERVALDDVLEAAAVLAGGLGVLEKRLARLPDFTGAAPASRALLARSRDRGDAAHR